LKISRGDMIAGRDALDLRKYFRSHVDGDWSYVTAMEDLLIGQQEALIAELVRLELIRKSESQRDKGLAI
jgi:hypothetical protein